MQLCWVVIPKLIFISYSISFTFFFPCWPIHEHTSSYVKGNRALLMYNVNWDASSVTLPVGWTRHVATTPSSVPHRPSETYPSGLFAGGHRTCCWWQQEQLFASMTTVWECLATVCATVCNTEPIPTTKQHSLHAHSHACTLGHSNFNCVTWSTQCRSSRRLKFANCVCNCSVLCKPLCNLSSASPLMSTWNIVPTSSALNPKGTLV